MIPDGPPPPDPGTLKVTKAVGDETGVPTGENVTVAVDCGEGTITQNLVIAATGGDQSISDIPADMECTISETDNAGRDERGVQPVDTATHRVG